MLWRDGDKLIYQCSFVHDRAHEGSSSIFSCPIKQINDFEYGVWDWLYSAIAKTAYTATSAACKVSDLYQSFLLDYIEYLIESGIDKQLEKERCERAKEKGKENK